MSLDLMSCATKCFLFNIVLQYKVEIPLEEHTFETGSTIRLECKVEGFPIPTINWFKNNARLPRSRRIYVEDEKFLVIKNASPIGKFLKRG